MVKKETKTLPFETHRNTSDESRSELLCGVEINFICKIIN